MLDIPFRVGFGAWGLQKPLLLWVNHMLMAGFFFVIGLEIKREVLVGELAGWQRAFPPAAGALGGMVVPALIYVAFCPGASPRRQLPPGGEGDRRSDAQIDRRERPEIADAPGQVCVIRGEHHRGGG